MVAARDIHPITELKNSAAELIREVSEEGRTVLITQHGEAKVVMMDAARYDEWRQTLALLKLLALSKDERDTLAPEDVFARVESELATPEVPR